MPVPTQAYQIQRVDEKLQIGAIKRMTFVVSSSPEEGLSDSTYILRWSSSKSTVETRRRLD